MNRKTLQKGSAAILLGYWLLAILFHWIAGAQLYFRDEKTEMMAMNAMIGELTAGSELRQSFRADADELFSVSLPLTTYDRTNTAHLSIVLEDAEGTRLGEIVLDESALEDGEMTEDCFPEPVTLRKGERYTLVLSSLDGAPGNACTVWYGTGISAARTEIQKNIPAEDCLLVNGQVVNGMLCFQLGVRTHLWFGGAYWYLAGICWLVLLVYALHLLRAEKEGKSTAALRLLSAIQRYQFLIRQLISRDFKTKYKRSVLGILWSFLNPLLIMSVQYLVFSTIFKSNISNFALYLLTGIVCFNFFSEATSMSLVSIVGNASLITKVYVPKYIYPVTRVLSSGVNLLFSIVPLFGFMLLTGTPFRPALLLLPFGVLCLLMLCTGMGLLLSTSMVFFRDTQFLWNVVSMLWMYLTPIFYPVSIIPDQWLTLYKCNPLYHIIRFFRILIIDGVSPEPKAYLLCFLVSAVPLLIGVLIFRRNQDKFILNL